MRTSSMYLATISLLSFSFFPSHSLAFETESKFSVPLSASTALGFLQSSDLDLKSRVMLVNSIEALPSMRVGRWQIGPHFDYRFQEQMTSLADAGGTNLKGHGPLMGVGLRYNFNKDLFVQGAVDFIGSYDLTKDTSEDEDDNLKEPLGIRAKAGYVFIKRIPQLTFDVDAHYLQFQKIHIAGVDRSKKFDQFSVGVGLTYHFDFGRKANDQPVVANVASESKVETVSEKMESIPGIKKDGENYVLSISGSNFDSNSAVLKDDSKLAIKEAAQKLANENVRFRIEGHTDSSGNEAKNKKLSLARAEALQSILVAEGIQKARTSVAGFGSDKPMASNKTKEGRAQNRRVEIYLQGSLNHKGVDHE